MLIDTHSHLYDAAFDADRDAALERATVAGIGKIFLPNINATTVQPMQQLAGEHPGFLYPMLGLHPEDLGKDWREVLAQMEKLLQHADHPFIAIGEVGLDYYWDRSLYDEQQEAFALQIQWAFDYDLPLMIHSRSAHREMVSIIRQSQNGQSLNGHSVNRQASNVQLRGVFHCFGGTQEEAEELLSFDGFCLGIGGVLTYKKSHLPEVLRTTVPLSRIVLETDSPYLAPVPYRGKRNESAFLVEVVKRLADIYGVSIQEVTETTTKNALRTFPKAQ